MNMQGFKTGFLNIFKKIKNNIVEVHNGRGNFSSMLYLWGLIPALIITIFFQSKINHLKSEFFSVFICLIITVYFLWHLLCIKNTLKTQPKYKIVKPSKKELFKDKTKEEIEAIKKEKRKEAMQKLLLLRAWDSTPNYVLVACFDAYVTLTQLQRIFQIIRY